MYFPARRRRCACRLVLFSNGRGSCLCVAGPTRRRLGRPISSAVAECLGAALIRKAGSIARDRRISTFVYLLQNACKLQYFEHSPLSSPCYDMAAGHYYSMLLGILHFLLRGGRLLVCSIKTSRTTVLFIVI